MRESRSTNEYTGPRKSRPFRSSENCRNPFRRENPGGEVTAIAASERLNVPKDRARIGDPAKPRVALRGARFYSGVSPHQYAKFPINYKPAAHIPPSTGGCLIRGHQASPDLKKLPPAVLKTTNARPGLAPTGVCVEKPDTSLIQERKSRASCRHHRFLAQSFFGINDKLRESPRKAPRRKRQQLRLAPKNTTQYLLDSDRKEVFQNRQGLSGPNGFRHPLG